MAYNRKNLLTRVSKIQDITLEHTRRGVTQEWVFHNVIFPSFTISKRTFYTYLGTPAKQELKRIEAQPKQMSLF